MADIIHLLPDSIANQIAAGEVIQRPASVVKELLENAIDAGATEITLNIKDAGKTLIQVIDNGMGMSETDARMSFERHATSKIKIPDDLFALFTLGFRGEALASIASIAQVELKTKRSDEELATHIVIEGSDIKLQEKISAPTGSNFMIKNLFFNVPARRKFLKTDTTEFNHILLEFKKVAIAFYQIGFKLFHNDSLVYNLPKTTLPKRLNQLFHAKIIDHSLPVEVETGILKVKGYAGKPEYATKTRGQQFFFVNNRYFRHNLFYRAVMMAYEKIIHPEMIPSFFLFINVEPESIDVNIHPTKTEIKFENEQGMMKIITSAVKQALGTFNAVPSIDFDAQFSLPLVNKTQVPVEPKVAINVDYNPFNKRQGYSTQKIDSNWNQLYIKSEKDSNDIDTNLESLSNTEFIQQYFFLKNKYILVSARSGLMMIHYRRAHERILYEYFMNRIAHKTLVSQNLMFPVIVTFSDKNIFIFNEIKDILTPFGFVLEQNDSEIEVKAVPPQLTECNVASIILDLIEAVKEQTQESQTSVEQIIALNLAKKAVGNVPKNMSKEEMQHIIDKLFVGENHNYTPDGKKIIVILNDEFIDNLF